MPDQFGAAERIAAKYGITREDVDWLGLVSSRRRRWPWPRAGSTARSRRSRPRWSARRARRARHRRASAHRKDQGPRETTAEGLAKLKPVMPDGMHTAGNSLADLRRRGRRPVDVRGPGQGRGPAAPGPHRGPGAGRLRPLLPPRRADRRHRRVLDKAGMTMGDIDLFEVNEAFASVVLSWARSTRSTWTRSTSTAGRSPSATRSARPAAG